MHKKIVLAVLGIVLLPALSSAAIFCPNLTENMKQGYCDQNLDDPDCAQHVTGDQVSQLQHFLKDYFNNPAGLWMSGYFGNKTKQYAMQFQEQWNLPAFGNVFGLTRAAIAQACGGAGTTATTTLPVSPPVDTTTILLPTDNGSVETSLPYIQGLMEPTVAASFWRGDQIRAVHAVNVRATASISGTILGTQSAGALGSIIGGPTYVDGYMWWNLNWDSGPDGWSVQNFLVETTENTSRSCTLDGLTVPHGGSATFYPVKFSPHECGSLGQTRTCNNGFLSGSSAYYAASCTVGEPPPPSLSCYLDGVTMQNGESRTFYPVRTSPHTCDTLGQTRTCNAGFLSGSSAYYSATCNGTTDTTTTNPSTSPTTSITAPTGGTTVANTVTINANASDDIAVTKVEFYVDGNLKGSDTTSPYSYSWDTTNNGTHTCSGAHMHTLTTKAYDAAGNVTTSAAVVVNMNNPPHCTTANASCTLDGVIVQSGQSATFYSASTVQSPNTCAAISQSRSCSNGTLSGSSSYNKASCSVTTASIGGTGTPTITITAPQNGVSVPSGSTANFSWQSQNITGGGVVAHMRNASGTTVKSWLGQNANGSVSWNVDQPAGQYKFITTLHSSAGQLLASAESSFLVSSPTGGTAGAPSCAHKGQSYPQGSLMSFNQQYPDWKLKCDGGVWAYSFGDKGIDICDLQDVYGNSLYASEYTCGARQPIQMYADPRYGAAPLTVRVAAYDRRCTNGSCQDQSMRPTTIQWGDGQSDTAIIGYNNPYFSSPATQHHTYTTPGIYTLTVTAPGGQASAKIYVVGSTASTQNQSQVAAAYAALESILKRMLEALK